MAPPPIENEINPAEAVAAEAVARQAAEQAQAVAQAEEIRQLIITRGQIKGGLTRFISFLSRFTDEKIANLESRLQSISEILIEFNQVQSKLEYLDPNELDTDERETFENRYFQAVGDAKDVIKKVNERISKNPNVAAQVGQPANISNPPQHSLTKNFPAIELVKFYGDYDKWAQFRDLFVTLVHNDSNIENIRKFYYLLGSLKGDAAKIVDSIQVTNQNYPIAWNLLVERYENPSLAVKNNIRALFNMQPVSKDRAVLRNLLDEFQKRYRALELLEEPVQHWDTMLIYLLTSKLDHQTLTLWEEHVIKNKVKQPRLQELQSFLTDRCKLLETAHYQIKTEHDKQTFVKNHAGVSEKSIKKPQSYASTRSAVKSFKPECAYCKQGHLIYHCEKFDAMSVAARVAEINKLNICASCFRSNHKTSDCISKECKVCGSKLHNTMLHSDNPEKTNDRDSSSAGLVVNHSIKNEPEILLSTALVLIRGYDGNWQRCTALLDNGSQSNFISSSLAKKLKLQTNKTVVPIVCVGNSSTSISLSTKTQIKSLDDGYSADISFLILDKITEKLPMTSFKKSLLNIPQGIHMADKHFNVSKDIDILIGAELFYQILGHEHITLGDHQPSLYKTVFGWIVSGPLLLPNNVKLRLCNLSINNDLNQKIEKFWELEQSFAETRKYYSAEEAQCEKIFTETLTRDASGRFIVTLPTRSGVGELGDSLEAAKRRLYSIERKFRKNPDFQQQYVAFMREYEQLNHMEKIPNSELAVETKPNVYYLPNHGVKNESSTTTSLRVVFDGSCASSTGISLNDLMVGPCIQDDLFSILLRFRKHTVVINADIEKMYRQVRVCPEQTDLQRIVWRKNSSDEISHFRLLTVTYGTSSASYLSTRALQQAAIENKEVYPEACEIILRDFYVDDLISGANSLEDATKLKSDICKILSKYGFNLRKWVSNESLVTGRESLGHDDKYYIYDDIRKTLGLIWHAKADVLSYTVKEFKNSGRYPTKRTLLSSISSIFDPLGLISPVIITFKIMMQKLWQRNLGWDDPVPNAIYKEWSNICIDLPLINSIKINRHALILNPNYIELHIFSDASEKAYGACAYLKSTNQNGEVVVQLLCSKSRVAPLKTVSIPRLELCGALLATQLYDKVINSIDLKIEKTYFWTDSEIVLAWLALSPSTLCIFVANRISEIHAKTNLSQWGHVPSEHNPADAVSRGKSASELHHLKMWWSGPEWLSQNQSRWPNQKPSKPTNLPEVKKNVVLTSVNATTDLFVRYSTLYRLQRILALCFRFYENCKNTNNKKKGNLTVSELDRSLNVLLKLAQVEMFPEEMHLIRRSKNLPKHSKLLSLNPFVGPDDLLRVGGRISKSDLPYNSKYQIILEPKHPLTKLIILNNHHKHLHAGLLFVLNSLREKYWIIHGRRTIRSVLSKCLTCFRVNPKKIVRQMGDLPVDRVRKYRPFYATGVDFAGPFNIKDGKLRNRAIIKAYLCIFICFSTKAVHLEAVSDLSSGAFLNALKRFVSRRGLCKILSSDNGTNFTGSNNELKQICDEIPKFVQDRGTADFLLQNRITWHFIPPRSPHVGGLWECGVKRAKYHITRVIGKNILTFEELSTLFAQVEAAMNSSPITPLSEDPSDLLALTPGHFLIGEPLLTLPEHDVTELPINRLTQFQRLQQMYQFFWKRWSRDYLLNLQQRTKWQTSSETSLQVGSMVLLIDENLPPLCWRLGRVVELICGDDNIARVAGIQTSSGLTKRAVQKICVLPVNV